MAYLSLIVLTNCHFDVIKWINMQLPAVPVCPLLNVFEGIKVCEEYLQFKAQYLLCSNTNYTRLLSVNWGAILYNLFVDWTGDLWGSFLGRRDRCCTDIFSQYFHWLKVGTLRHLADCSMIWIVSNEHSSSINTKTKWKQFVCMCVRVCMCVLWIAYWAVDGVA